MLRSSSKALLLPEGKGGDRLSAVEAFKQRWFPARVGYSGPSNKFFHVAELLPLRSSLAERSKRPNAKASGYTFIHKFVSLKMRYAKPCTAESLLSPVP